MPRPSVTRPFAALVAILALAAGSAASADSDASEDAYRMFPADELFAPLVADVRWPRFSAEHQWRFGTGEFNRVAAVSFGETFAFVRSPEQSWGVWELGFQAMVDALFDMTQPSFDLSNEDYFVGLTASVRTGSVTTQLRVSHTSSHAGDEYLLTTGRGRDEISFETIDVLVSTEPAEWLRVYGGLGVLFNPSPSFDPLVFQLGAEWLSPVSFWKGRLTPVFGTDVQLKQEDDWVPEVAVLAGLRLADPENPVRNVEFYTRYYHGRSPDGQFFRQTIDSLGVGLRLGF